MTTKEHQAFASELRLMDAGEVRENTNAAIQPDAAKRAMAVTELERRRQARAPNTIRNPIRMSLLLIAFAGIVGATAYWLLL